MKLPRDAGKLLDPFADSLSRLTYFLSFTMAGFLPAWIFLVLLYRDLAGGFVRFLVLRRGVALRERFSGTAKTIVYGIAGCAGLLMLTTDLYASTGKMASVVSVLLLPVFILAGAVAVWSLLDYTVSLIKMRHGND